MLKKHSPQILSALALVVGLAPPTLAQHADIMVQQIDGKLVTGVADLEGNSFEIPRQVFVGSLLSNYRALDPGFFSLDEDSPLLPAGALPAGSDLYFDFLPMTVGVAVSNLFYWDGLDTNDVEFSVPDNAAFKIVNNGTYTADASDQLVGGGLVATTAFDGSIHKHPAYRLETLDATTPDEGVYLVSMQLRMNGLATSDPLFLAMRTSTLGNDELIAAQNWIDDNLQMLTSPPVIAGDYNGDGLVNLADYTVWRNTLGSTTNLAANGDNTDSSQALIDAADYVVWKDNFGYSLTPTSAVASSSVPEPATCYFLATCGVSLLLALQFARSGQKSPSGAQ